MDFENVTGPGLEVGSTGAGVNDKTNLVTVIWSINLTAFVLVGLIVPLRVIVRCTVTRNFFSDDVLVIIAALFTFGICSSLPIATDLGLGQHSWNIDAEALPDNTKSLLQLIFIANILYPCAIVFTRLSAICSFLRLIPEKRARWTMFAAATITGGFAVASVFGVVFQCKPISAAWDLSISDASCYPFLNFLHASTAIGIAIDALLCTVPLAYFWKMKTSLVNKLLVTALFMCAGVSCVVAAIKLANLQLLEHADVTYNWTVWVLCSIAECTVGIAKHVFATKVQAASVRLLWRKGQLQPSRRASNHQADGDAVEESTGRDHEKPGFQTGFPLAQTGTPRSDSLLGKGTSVDKGEPGPWYRVVKDMFSVDFGFIGVLFPKI